MTISTETSLLPERQGKIDPFKRLAAAVISQAVEDATTQMGKEQRSAATWLLEDEDGFPFWCDVLGMNPDQTRQELTNLLSSRKGYRVDFQTLSELTPEDHSFVWSSDVLNEM